MHLTDWPPSETKMHLDQQLSSIFDYIGQDGCKAIPDYDRLVISEHGRVSGMHEMKSEIYKRGPISCVISATRKL